MLAAMMVGAVSGAFGETPAERFDPVLRDVEGWKVHVEPMLLDGQQAKMGRQSLTMLANHLQRVKILIPAEPLAKLQAIEIWIEHDHPQLKSMQYHPDRQWLIDHGHDPRLTRKVHITQARELLSREQLLKHPAAILHELAHGYHDQVLGFDNPEVIGVFERARAAGTYDQVLLYDGKTVRHYGLGNHKEYFAEGTEAYFYRNDFYPFVRAELKQHDQPLHDLLEKLWGVSNDAGK
jgi:dipeptidyl-peptidase-4